MTCFILLYIYMCFFARVQGNGAVSKQFVITRLLPEINLSSRPRKRKHKKHSDLTICATERRDL